MPIVASVSPAVAEEGDTTTTTIDGAGSDPSTPPTTDTDDGDGTDGSTVPSTTTAPVTTTGDAADPTTTTTTDDESDDDLGPTDPDDDPVDVEDTTDPDAETNDDDPDVVDGVAGAVEDDELDDSDDGDTDDTDEPVVEIDLDKVTQDIDPDAVPSVGYPVDEIGEGVPLDGVDINPPSFDPGYRLPTGIDPTTGRPIIGPATPGPVDLPVVERFDVPDPVVISDGQASEAVDASGLGIDPLLAGTHTVKFDGSSKRFGDTPLSVVAPPIADGVGREAVLTMLEADVVGRLSLVGAAFGLEVRGFGSASADLPTIDDGSDGVGVELAEGEARVPVLGTTETGWQIVLDADALEGVPNEVRDRLSLFVFGDCERVSRSSCEARFLTS